MRSAVAPFSAALVTKPARRESQRADRAQLLMLTLATAEGDLIAPGIRDALLLYLGDGTDLEERQAEAS